MYLSRAPPRVVYHFRGVYTPEQDRVDKNQRIRILFQNYTSLTINYIPSLLSKRSLTTLLRKVEIGRSITIRSFLKLPRKEAFHGYHCYSTFPYYKNIFLSSLCKNNSIIIYITSTLFLNFGFASQ